MMQQLISEKICAAIADAKVDIKSEDGVHFSVVVAAASFRGKSRLQQHRMVMNALQSQLASNEIHAIALKTIVVE